MKRYLFLDIDGVIAGEDEWGIMLEDKSCAFNRNALDALEHIVGSFPDVHIIISSTWRKGTTVEELQQIFKRRGFKYWRNGEKYNVADHGRHHLAYAIANFILLMWHDTH